MTNAKETKRQAREAAEAAKIAQYKDDIGALLDKIGQDATGSNCAANLAAIRSTLKELVASQMYHLYDGDEAATNEAIEDNLSLMRDAEAERVREINEWRTKEYKRAHR